MGLRLTSAVIASAMVLSWPASAHKPTFGEGRYGAPGRAYGRASPQ